jgi:hypothetical protein
MRTSSDPRSTCSEWVNVIINGGGRGSALSSYDGRASTPVRGDRSRRVGQRSPHLPPGGAFRGAEARTARPEASAGIACPPHSPS